MSSHAGSYNFSLARLEGAGMMPPARPFSSPCPRDPSRSDGRRRRKFPPGNAQAKERQGLTASSGERWLGPQGKQGVREPSTEGVRHAQLCKRSASPISQVQGQRGGGREESLG